MNTRCARDNMLKQQLRTGGVLDEKILKLYSDLPRECFVPEEFKAFAYCDSQIELAHQQRMMTPLEEALLLQSLALKGTETVLEVGTGSGFLTAMLSRLSHKVVSLDIFPDLVEKARVQLLKQECNNVELIVADGYRGWMDKAPYDVMVISGAIESIQETHLLQISSRGKLWAIVGTAPVMQAQLYSMSTKGDWHKQLIFETNIPPLLDKLKHKTFVF